MIRNMFWLMLGGLAATLAMFIANPSYFSNDASRVEDGIYTVYHVQAAYDENTGEPVFWVTGKPVRVTHLSDIKSEAYVNRRGIKFFSIPRSRTSGYRDDMATSRDDKVLVVEGGKGTFM